MLAGGSTGCYKNLANMGEIWELGSWVQGRGGGEGCNVEHAFPLGGTGTGNPDKKKKKTRKRKRNHQGE